jgi:dTMP kinase
VRQRKEVQEVPRTGIEHGLFVTFEGIDGCGKSTQVQRAAETLRREGRAVCVTREPGGPPIAERIREVLMAPEHREMTPACEVLLYLAARAQHVTQTIAPALARGEVVLCDRFADATLAYQGYGRELPLDALTEMNAFAAAGLKPDLTLLFDITVELSRERLAAMGRGHDRMESGALEFYGRIRQGYLELAKRRPERFVVLDGARPLEENAGRVVAAIRARLGAA